MAGAGGELSICQEQRGRSEKGKRNRDEKASVASFLNKTSITPRVRRGPKRERRKEARKERETYLPFVCKQPPHALRYLSISSKPKCSEAAYLSFIRGPIRLSGRFIYSAWRRRRRRRRQREKNGGIIISPLSIVGNFARRSSTCSLSCSLP